MRRKASVIDTALSIGGQKFMAWSGQAIASRLVNP
jgi:hypothetical protein